MNFHETEFCKNRSGCEKTASAVQLFGFKTVAGYRLYCLDGANKVASAEWIEADDDYAAIEVAKEMHDGRECEVWQGRRLIGRLDLRRRG